MLKNTAYLFLFFIIAACVEPYQFVIRDDEPSLVIEAYLSDKSYNETLTYPSDGRYFTVKLSYTGDVTNVRSKPVSYAVVELRNDRNETWYYTESAAVAGVYELLDDDFKAERDVRYKLRIQLPEEEIYESDWEALPATETPPMGAIGFKEFVMQKYAIQANEEVVVSVKAVQTQIEIPENTLGVPLYYRWSFVPHWIYIAPLSPSVVLPGHTCWATTPYYLRNYAIQKDFAGGYKKDLFSMETVRNERIFEQFSVLIVQHAITEPYYTFWSEMREQNQEASIVDKPPFNLATNFHALDSEKRVFGFFGVVNEQATRWYFSKKDLSYFVENTLKEDCLKSYGGPPAPECFDCREYSRADATNVKPSWWVD
jgi:hypothetical protein